MKTIARNVVAISVASSFLALAACGGGKPADAKDASSAEEGEEKKELEEMKGNRMEKADAEE